jgi:signal transduction histidine kinase
VSVISARLPAALAGLSRRRDDRIFAGVCAGLARSARVDATLVRLVFALGAVADGAGLVAYVAAVLMLPDESGSTVSRRRRYLGAGLTLVAAGLLLHSIGIADSVLWPAVMATAGVYHIQSDHSLDRRRTRQRRLIGWALIAGAAVLFIMLIGVGDTPGSGVASTSVIVALALIVGPWIWRLAQERDAERLERIRAQERADVAARVHDSVLQTLTLVQRSAGDPRRVAALARRQERELRTWLYGDRAAASGATLRSALEDMVADVEELHGVRIELVQTGDRTLDERLDALVLAAREAASNAAVHSGVDEISVFVQVADDEAVVYIRDRGGGFDRAAVSPERRGLVESIEGRMDRNGGTALARSTPGEGTEVELRLPIGGNQ